MPSPFRLLLVDDDPSSLHLVERFIEAEGFQITTASNAEEAKTLAQEIQPHLIITDIILPGKDGFQLLGQLKEKMPQVEVILLTGHASVERAVEAIRDGACDYLEKPVERSRLIASLRKAKQQIALRIENTELRNRLTNQAHDTLVGQSPLIEQIRRTIERVASSSASVFIEGESGTGKEVATEMLHRFGNRANEPFIKVSCAAIPDNLLESEMFGFAKGAFTGAMQAKAGKFEIAHRGTLFLDEIGEMSPVLQAKLLRVLQDGKVTRLGSNQEHEVDVRVIAATNVDIQKAIQSGKFREDLFYRLNVVRFRMPPLRDHLEDIPLLIAHFLGRLRYKLNLEELELSPEALRLLQSHQWPGNVRELSNALERAVALKHGSILEPHDFSLNYPVTSHQKDDEEGLLFKLGTPLQEVENRMIQAAMDACGGDKEKAAILLGISARTIYRKLESTKSDQL